MLLALCLALGPVVRAAPAPALDRTQLYPLLQEANTAFQQANAAGDPDVAKPLYDKAILLYEKLIDRGGVHNAKLYYNLANAYLLKDDLGRAILNYRRAAKQDGADLNIQKNLAFARSRKLDRVETSTEKRVLGTLFFWHYDFSLKTKLLLAAAFFAALCTALILAIWMRSARPFGLGQQAAVNPPSAPRAAPWPVWVAALCGVLFICLLVSVFVETKRAAAVRPGVITAAAVVARQGDGPNYPPSFKDALHTGLEFELLEQRPGWLHIRLSDGTDAWIPDETAGLV